MRPLPMLPLDSNELALVKLISIFLEAVHILSGLATKQNFDFSHELRSRRSSGSVLMMNTPS